MKTSLPGMVGAALLFACAGSPLPQPTAADVSRGASAFPDLTLDELSQGRRLYVSRCGSCHALKAPAELSASRWAEEVEAMRRENGVKLTDDEAQAIVRYLSLATTRG
jgi:mono/diheme cytochrome c family protein